MLRLPKWYGLTIILIYSVMIAEFVKVLNTLFMVGGIEKVALMEKIVQLNYGLTIVSSIIVWILICLLFHLMALLFDGKTTFGSFLIVAAYPYFRHYKIFCVNGNTGFRNESRIFYFIHLQNEEAYERKESSSA